MIINCNHTTKIANGGFTIPHGPNYGQRFSYTMFLTMVEAVDIQGYMVDCFTTNGEGEIVDSFSRQYGDKRRPFTMGEAKSAARKLAKRNLMI